MKRNSINCSCDDYDFYTIPVPLKVIFRRKKKHYISSLLEKLHPCFNDDCSFDSHLHLEKSGIKANVVVMQKLKLAEYKSNNKRLYIQEQKHHQIFAGKQKKTVIAAAGFLLLIIAVTIKLVFSSAHNFESEQNAAEIPEPQTALPAATMSFCLPDFLQRIAELTGTIQTLNWNYDGYNENFSVSVKGVYPEQLEDFSNSLKVSSVEFDSFVPLMTVNVTEHNVQSSATFIDYTFYKNDFRKLIEQNHVTLIEETVKPYGVRFSVQENQEQELVTLFDYLNANNFCFSSININSSAQAVNVELVFSQVQFEGQATIIQTIINNLHLFFHTQDTQQTTKTEEQNKLLQKSQPQKTALVKVGQIIKPDGSVSIFYKDENGKIIKR